jgi:hypothetical protein
MSEQIFYDLRTETVKREGKENRCGPKFRQRGREIFYKFWPKSSCPKEARQMILNTFMYIFAAGFNVVARFFLLEVSAEKGVKCVKNSRYFFPLILIKFNRFTAVLQKHKA